MSAGLSSRQSSRDSAPYGQSRESAPTGQECHAPEGHCITCGDQGIAMLVVRAGDLFATCRDEQHRLHEVAIDLVAPVGAGDGILVHAGVAIGHLEALT